MRTSTRSLLALAVLPLAFLAACGDDDTTDTTVPASTSTTTSSTLPVGFNITTVLSTKPQFSTLEDALHASGLDITLDGNTTWPHYTLFAPTNAAFNNLPTGVLDKLLLPKNKDALIKVLSFHVLEGDILERDFSAGVLSTLEGQDLVVQHQPTVYVNGATVSATDILASNGVIHQIDKVLIPDSVDVSEL